jgi:hypothetical protein
MLRKKVRVYRSHVARLRQELTSLNCQRHLTADLSSADFPPPPSGWSEQGNFDRLLNDEGKSEFPKNSRRQRSAASEQYWADRKASSTSLKSVLRIHDILVWIWIRGSMPLTNKSGSGFCYFRHWPSRCQQKTNLKKGFFAYYFLKVHLHHFQRLKVKKK